MAGLNVWLKRLDDPATRRQAIQALQDLGDVIALDALAAVFASDPDPETRMMAQQAGKAIYFGQIRQEQYERGPSLHDRQRAGEILTQAAHTKKRRRL